MQFQGNKQPAVEMVNDTKLTVQVQQPQTPTSDHILGNDGGRTEYDIIANLYRASVQGDLKAAKDILRDDENVLRYITPNMETPLHVAIMSRNTKFVRELVDMMSKSELELKNSDGNTAFCLAAISGNVVMAKIMIKKNSTLPTICGTNNMTSPIEEKDKTTPTNEKENNMTPATEKEDNVSSRTEEKKIMPLCLAALHRKRDMVTFLYRQSERMKDESWREHRNEVLLKYVALQILRDNKELPQDNHLTDVLLVLAQNPGVFTSPNIISKIRSYFVTSDNGILLLQLLLEGVAKKPRDKIHEILRGPMIKEKETETYPSRILFTAAKMNNSRFLAEMFRHFPDLIWQRNDDGQTIFHVAVAHRHRDVYKLLLKSVGSMKDFITPIVDKKGNNILHMVGNIPQKLGYEDLETTPYEILCEYFWYKEVESTLPRRYTQGKNTKGITPEEKFIEGHKEQISKGTDWIYETVNQSMVVAALVCTIGFSIVYSIPGGFDETGYPIFHESNTFFWFILIEAVSFLLSGTSMLIFISIILSRHGHRKEILFERWLAGQEALLASLASLAIAFLTGVFLLYRNNILPYIISAIAILLFAIYLEEYITFLLDGFYLTHRSMYLFRLKKYTTYFHR
ncbi:uncharacterized protein LOC143543790 [Bidens hawaiensis]|uniref:uncharacterized protein LOC143543790 n=1 Tax=Bidens hawaiensis TaxID=980011 RepID=UPI004048F734